MSETPDLQRTAASLRKISGDARWDAVVKVGEEWAVSYPFETGLYVTGFASKEDADLIAEMLARWVLEVFKLLPPEEAEALREYWP